MQSFIRSQIWSAAAVVFVLVVGLDVPALAIDYGTPVADGQYPTIGMIVVNVGENQAVAGTGTLIARNVVLTAAHVVQDAPTPGHIKFRTELSADKEFSAGVVLYRTHPGYLNLRSDSVATDDERVFMETDMIAASACDVALLLLDKPVPEDVKFYPLSKQKLKPGAEVTAVGFGLDEGKKSGNSKKLQGTLQFLKEQDGALLFRTPKGSNQRSDHGDSGGPLLLKDGDQEELAAVTHGYFTAVKVDGLSPDEFGIYVSIPNQQGWIEETVQQLSRYKQPASPAFYLARNSRRTPFPAVTARQIFSLASADTPVERLVGRAFARGINEPIPGDIAAAWQKRYKLPPGMLVPVKTE